MYSYKILPTPATPYLIKNIAYEKVVTVTYSNAAGNWVSGQTIYASYSGPISGTSYEIWKFSGSIGSGGIKQFYLRYDVQGNSYYDNNYTQYADSTSNPGATNVPAELTPCNTWNGLDACSGQQTDYDASYDQRMWQTPARGSIDWSEGFQDYRDLTGYVDLVYNAARTSVTVNVIANSRTGAALTYSFNGGAFGSSSSATVTSSFTGAYAISVRDAKGKSLVFDRECTLPLMRIGLIFVCKRLTLSGMRPL
ncbi:hypothetical protein DXG03_000546 [Asterophora parasitica]|uniref:CBM21 domain-containing protein n=1 Tax=Asterophora parasitica TaxID=117018 RepID=A0A9P7K7P7_9AGAR|nr:hypothetical protein DXG03_000546 [Asterophora parasitica]